MNHEITNNRTNEITIKQKIKLLFNGNISLRALYISSREERERGKLSLVETRARFLVGLLARNFNCFSDDIVIDESVIEYFLGANAAKINYISLYLNSIYGKFLQDEATYGWERFYYLQVLPSKKLLHLTNLHEKKLIAHLCRENSLSRADASYAGANTNNAAAGFSQMNEEVRRTAISVFDMFDQDNSAKKALGSAVTIFGFHRTMTGIGEDARRLFDILISIGIRVELFDCAPSALEKHPEGGFYELFETSRPTAQVAIFCLPFFEMTRLIPLLTPAFFKNRYIVGYWPWELPSIPAGWREFLNLADEIWASSKFLCDVFRTESDRPVYEIPLCVEIEAGSDDNFALRYISPGVANFISVFDFNSSTQRKNPVGSIQAFKRAFDGSGIGAALILKSLHGRKNEDDYKSVVEEIGGDSRIILLDQPLRRSELNALIKYSTAFLSLHRSEGFGRLLVEAMLLGTPVIATDWSGSQGFVDSERAFPIRFRMRAVEADEYPYASGEWAEPDIHDAAEKMKQIALGEFNCSEISSKAFRFVKDSYSRAKVSLYVADRLNAVGSIINTLANE